MLDQAHVVVPAQMRHFLAEPSRAWKHLILSIELQLGDDEPGIRAGELVDLELEPLVLDVVPRLLDQRPGAKLQQLARLAERNRILVLEPRSDEPPGFDVQMR